MPFFEKQQRKYNRAFKISENSNAMDIEKP